MAKNADEDVWIGLNDKSVEDSFVWSDGTNCSFRQWPKKQPNNGKTDPENCTQMKKGSGQWDDKKCSDEKYYVCETPLLTTGTTFGHFDIVIKLFKLVTVSSVINAMPVMLDSQWTELLPSCYSV